MSNPFVRSLRVAMCASAATVALVPGYAFAQQDAQTAKVEEQAAGGAANTSSEEPADDEIVVTGTLIRGTAPVGSNSIVVGQARIEETAASTANELLATLPQVTNYFNRIPLADLGIAVNQIQIARPNIRNIGVTNAASSATLILVDGHRIASAGISQASIDPDIIPTGAIERVDVVTEGGSSIYGADAVAGVINFITRKRYNGVKVEGHYGFADDYWQADASVTAGKAWDTGSAYVSYNFSKSSPLYGRDRDYIRGLSYSALPYVGRDIACAPGNLSVNTIFVPANVVIGSATYAAPGFVRNTANRCENVRNSTVVPASERHGVMAGLNQEFGDKTTVDVRAYYGQRESISLSTLTANVTLGANNPFTKPTLDLLGIVPGGNPIIRTSAVANISFEPIYGLDSARSTTSIKEWGAYAEIKHDLSDAWQLRGLLNWSQSDSRFELTGVNQTRLDAAGAATTTSTAISPFNLSQTNRAVLDDIVDNEIAGQAKDRLLNIRLIAEGTLFALPGGEVKLAAGYEYSNDSYQQRYQSDIRIGTLNTFPFGTYSRNLHSLFGELLIPLVGADNGFNGLRSLVVSASGRYDHYSDFGDTFNPKIGVTYKPVDGFAIRGNWGTSFTAPTPLDQLGSSRNTISSFGFVAFIRPEDAGVISTTCCTTVAIQGSRPNLQPQTAETWSVGVDLDPLSGLHASLNYYSVAFKDILRTPTPGVGIFTDFPGSIQTNTAGLSPEVLRAFGALAPGGSAVVEPLIASGTRVYEAVDFRVGNFGTLDVAGVDFTVNYRRKTDWGGFDVNVNGNLPLKRQAQNSPIAAVTDQLRLNAPTFFLTASAGVDVGNFRGLVTLNHTSGYNITPTSSVPVQSDVDAFNTVDLFFRYKVPSESNLLKDLSLTLNIRNAFDTDPPAFLGGDGYTNGFTLGRLFILGVSKEF